MAGDHLTARQTGSGYTVLGQHPLTDSSSGVYSRSETVGGNDVNWTAQNAASLIQLPRCGKAGTHLLDVSNGKTLQITDNNVAMNPVTSGITLECVATCTTTAYNYFGGAWNRTICAVWGSYGYNITIQLSPTNDVIGDTTGRARANTTDIGGTRIATRTTHSRPVISDGLPHHIALTHEPTGTSNVVKLYVDGVNTETLTLTAAMSSLDQNTLKAGLEDSGFGFTGSVSHMCLTAAVLTVDEIKARAQLVNGASGPVLTDQGAVMAWSATDRAWLPVNYAYASTLAGYTIIKPPS